MFRVSVQQGEILLQQRLNTMLNCPVGIEVVFKVSVAMPVVVSMAREVTR
jgi:hypothetical protein